MELVCQEKKRVKIFLKDMAVIIFNIDFYQGKWASLTLTVFLELTKPHVCTSDCALVAVL